MNRKIKFSLLGTLIASSFLAITLPIVSCSSSTSDIELIIEDSVIENVVDTVTKSLRDKMQAPGITNSQQRELAAKWSVDSEIEKDELDIIKKELIFKGGNKEFKYDEVVENVSITKGIEIPTSGNINGPELKINLKDGYIGDISIQVDQLGNVIPIGLTMSDSGMRNVVEVVTKSLNAKMQKDGINLSQQIELASTWKVGEEIHQEEKELIDRIKDKIEFIDINNKRFFYDEAVKSITFETPTIIPNDGSNINGPKLRVNFNDGYFGDVIIQVGDLGGAFLPTELVVENSVMENVVDLVTESLTNKMQRFGITIPEQMKLASSWSIGSEIEEDELNIIKEKLNFKDANGKVVQFSDAVKNVTFESETVIPFVGEIIGPKLKVNLKDGYTSNQDIIIEVGILGDIALPAKLIIEDSVMRNVVDTVTNSLFNKMQTKNITKAEQIELSTKWSIGSEIEKEELNIIKKELKFKNGNNEVTYDEVVKNVTFNSETTIGKFNDNIEGPELKINFNFGYTGDDLIKINSLGNVAPLKLTITEDINKTIADAITESLTKKMQSDGISSESQKKLATEWSKGSSIPDDELNIFKEKLIFEDSEVKYEDAVESITFDSDIIIGKLNDSINGPKLKVNFNEGYIGDISIQIDSLGNVAPSKLLDYDDNDLITITNEVTNLIKDLFMNKFSQDRFRQEFFSKNYYIKDNKYFAGDDDVGDIFSKLNFTNGDGNKISSDQSINHVWVIEGITIPEPGQPIKGPIFSIEFKDGYSLNRVLIIETGTIGIALNN